MRVPLPRSKHPFLAAIRYVWTLPTNAVGHLIGWALAPSRPDPIGSDAARAWLYRLARGSRLRPIGAVTIGSTIICAPEFLDCGPRRRVVLAHELSHVRQHDWLGPLYLPLHLLAQISSAGLSVIRPRAGFTPQHAYNPLEECFLAVPFSAIGKSDSPLSEGTSTVLTAFGV